MEKEKLKFISDTLRTSGFKFLLVTDDGKLKKIAFNGYKALEEKPIIFFAEDD